MEQILDEFWPTTLWTAKSQSFNRDIVWIGANRLHQGIYSSMKQTNFHPWKCIATDEFVPCTAHVALFKHIWYLIALLRQGERPSRCTLLVWLNTIIFLNTCMVVQHVLCLYLSFIIHPAFNYCSTIIVCFHILLLRCVPLYSIGIRVWLVCFCMTYGVTWSDNKLFGSGNKREPENNIKNTCEEGWLME